MSLVLSLLLAAVPALLIVMYFNRRDRYRPEPRGRIIRVFLLGLLSTVPAIIIELAVSEFRYWLNPYEILFPLFKAFVIAGLVEEGIKYLTVMKFAYPRENFDEVMDGVVFTVIAGMGFACMENILFVLGRGMAVGVLRAFTSIPMHASVSVIMGYCIGRAKFSPSRRNRNGLLLRGLLLAILFHGLYDLSIFAMPFWSEISILALFPVLIIAIWLARRLTRKALALDIQAGRTVIPR